MAMATTWLDRAIGRVMPQWQLRRVRARIAADLVQRHYEAAAIGRRTQGWNRSTGDANAASGASLARLRDVARDLVRNNPYAKSAVETIAQHVVGWGIEPSVELEVWNAWAGTTACDADGRHNLAGLQKVVMRGVVESGEVLIRRRARRAEDGLPIPIQLQVLEADHLDTLKDGPLTNGGRIIQGVELDPLGRRVAYWLFREHPGASQLTSRVFGQSVRVPAEQVAHVFLADRPGAQRGVSWFAPVILRFKDFDEFEDATLMKQKIAACLAVITSDVDGTAAPLGTTTTEDPDVDSLEPGLIMNVAPGRSVEVVQPPTVREYADFTKTSLRGIATGLGVAYEDLTGDYTEMPFSAARMSRIRHWARVEDWRWRMLIPQFLEPVWGWAMTAAEMTGAAVSEARPEWTAPPLPMIDPEKEGLGVIRNIRAGVTTHFEAVRERGYNVDQFFDEYQKGLEELDRRSIVLDSDARKMTQAGQAQSVPASDTEGARLARVGGGR